MAEFKWKRADTGEWVCGEIAYRLSEDGKQYTPYLSLYDKDTFESISSFVPVLPHTMCEYTGVKGSGGVKIYEGDIVKKKLPYVKETYTVVRGSVGFFLEARNGATQYLMGGSNYTVIGNRHDKSNGYDG